CLVLVPAYSSLSRAEDPKTNPAVEMVVAAGLEAAKKQDWKKYADLVDPESLQDYKKMWLPVLQAATKDAQDKQADLLPLFEKATDLKSVMAWKPREFFARSMTGMESQVKAPKPSQADTDTKIIGTLRVGDELAY